MSAKIARLTDRGVVSVTGRDSEKLLQGLVTNDLEGLEEGQARHAGLLSPQGKVLFDFFVVRSGGGYLLDVARNKAADLAKRLAMYKLRADVAIADRSPSFGAYALWGDSSDMPSASPGVVIFNDPRSRPLGLRLLAESHPTGSLASALAADEVTHQEYDALRIRHGVPEGGKDYDFGDAYPHEADFDLFNGVSFAKGCYVGQEVVARMQHKTVVRKRVVKIAAASPLKSGADIRVGDVLIGKVGSVDGGHALAMLRLDRAVEAQQKTQALLADGMIITPDEDALARYRRSAGTQTPAAAGP